jgi:hypothetical protein
MVYGDLNKGKNMFRQNCAVSLFLLKYMVFPGSIKIQ